MASRWTRLPAIRGIGIVAVLLAIGAHAQLGPGGAAPAAHGSPVQAAAWPTPQEETFHTCRPDGDGGDRQLNLRKNRIDSGVWQPVPLASLLALTWPASVDRVARKDWSAGDAATVAQNEGRPVITEGWILTDRHEGTESTNCHDPAARDYHVWLAVSPGDSRARSMVVEITPRVAARTPGWGDERAILALAGRHARIAGWLLLDQEYPEQLHHTRGTLWEIHPVMGIIIEKFGQWIDVATGKPPAATPSPAGATPTATGAAQATPTPTPGAPPATPTAHTSISGPFAVAVTVDPDPTSDGTPTTVTGHTTTGAQCTVRVVYASGSASSAADLQTTQTAGNDGVVSWTWKPSTHTPGTATATVTCSLNGQSATGTAQFTIR